jgi:predicted glycogen debranching enzyme
MEPFIPIMTPAPGERLLRFVGDRVRFELRDRDGRRAPPGWSARLRTNLGRAGLLRREIVQAHTAGLPLAGASWRDLPMRAFADGWSLELPLAESGFFKAKAYLLDEKKWQHWPDGPDMGLSVHPDVYRTANTIYCAFPRLFGATRTAGNTQNERLENQIRHFEQNNYTIIPPSGKLRDLTQCLPHIIDRLGCRIVHLLPVNPTPTTFARFGRFGSPYAALDLTAIDPALVVFDKRTTGLDQFRELTYATHLRGGRVFIDIVINHTGWGSNLRENHPEWFVRQPDGTFVSPGAWGTTWEDLVELKHENVALWDQLAEMFLTWCRRGVDGFRCDAGYKVPVPAWQYIIARVQQEFPESLFLLEGLGGSWATTEALLTEGGMQWAYSELFQNYSGRQVADYLDYSLKQSVRTGLFVHYSETHDNDRLAARGRAWSLLRNRLCALTAVGGGFGFSGGVEWLATEKIKVHGCTGLAWDNPKNLMPEIAQLNRLLAEHPCFFDGAKLRRLSPPDSPVYALLRESAEGKDTVLVLVNTELEKESSLSLSAAGLPAEISGFKFELLGQSPPAFKTAKAGEAQITLSAGAACCLSPAEQPKGLSGDAYRRARAQAGWAVQALSQVFPVNEIGPYQWTNLAERVGRSPFDFLASLHRLDLKGGQTDLRDALERAAGVAAFPRVIRWSLIDCRRVTPVPPDHWLLIEDPAPFRATLGARNSKGEGRNGSLQHVQSIAVREGHVACFPPRRNADDAVLTLERYADTEPGVEATIRFLGPVPENPESTPRLPQSTDLVLLTNGIGGMARLGVDPGHVSSKYDCVLGANLHSGVPVDRHVFAKRIRVWINAGGFISPLNFQNLAAFEAGPPARWRFVANAGDGHTVEIEMCAEMVAGRNTTAFRFLRKASAPGGGNPLPGDVDVRLTVRVDIEDRNFHSETKRNGGADFHFSSNTVEIQNSKSEKQNALGFAFTPAPDRQLYVVADAGEYYSQPEWSENIPHPVEQSRGQAGAGDAWSPGWFELPLKEDAPVNLVVTAEADDSTLSLTPAARVDATPEAKAAAGPADDPFAAALRRAAGAFVVRRGSGKTVIAGYPWFLDWGRDTFICARGILAAGQVEDVREILVTFARFEQDGTLPNTIQGENASNRDTSDAPLWFGVVCEELAAAAPDKFYSTPVGAANRTIRDVLQSIAQNYIRGTPNGIRMDADSALVWSPAHFTWMDTNFPAATPREGYPVEIQVLWIRLLRQLARWDETKQKYWSDLADRALASFEKFFWLEQKGFYADVLLAKKNQPAAGAAASDALRSNCLFAVSLGVISGARAKRCVEAALKYLVVPGALRSLAPLTVSVPLPVNGNDGRMLNDPANPYWGRYEGDEDTRRKPAYHNGTAWTWTFPVFCEALARAWDSSPEAIAAARAYLGSMDRLMVEGCLGQIPEILDGDAPHSQRGCDAQAWGVTEALRVWKLLKDL